MILGPAMVLFGTFRIAPAEEQVTPVAPAAGIAADSDSPPAVASLEYPLRVRFSESLFVSPEPEITETTPVEQCVLGVLSRGTAFIQGQLRPNFIPSEDHARVELVFNGTLTSRTQGQRGPATIHTTTTSRFDLRVALSFTREHGFEAAEPVADVRVVAMRPSFSTHLPGLRGSLVRKVAAKRWKEKETLLHGIARCRAEKRLIENLNRRVAELLPVWNRHWSQLSAALETQAWYSGRESLVLATDDQSLVVHVHVLQSSAPVDPARAKEHRFESPAPARDSLVEVLVLTEGFRFVEPTGTAETYLLVISEWLSDAFSDDDAIEITTRKEGDWTILAVTETPQS